MNEIEEFMIYLEVALILVTHIARSTLCGVWSHRRRIQDCLQDCKRLLNVALMLRNKSK